jgi:hypothetical protein
MADPRLQKSPIMNRMFEKGSPMVELKSIEIRVPIEPHMSYRVLIGKSENMGSWGS